MKRKYRLSSAKAWIPNYSGKNIVKGYANWFGTDLICSIKELRMNGVLVSEEYEKKVLNSIKANLAAKQKKDEIANQMKFKELGIESDGNFAFIAGYTSGGMPFGITHAEILDDTNENRPIDND